MHLIIQKILHYGFMKSFPQIGEKMAYANWKALLHSMCFLTILPWNVKGLKNASNILDQPHVACGWVENNFFLLGFFAWVNLLHFVVMGPYKFQSYQTMTFWTITTFFLMK